MNEGVRGKSGRRPTGQGDTRSHLLAMAVDAFAQRGYEGVSIRDLSGAADVNVAMVAYHFGSKLELWRGCVDQLADRITPSLAGLREALDPSVDYVDRLRSFAMKFIELNASIPNFGLFIHQEALCPGVRRSHVAERLIEPVHEIAVALLKEGMDAGLVRRANPSLLFFMAATSVSSIVAGRSLVRSFDDAGVDDEAFDRELLQATLDLLHGGGRGGSGPSI